MKRLLVVITTRRRITTSSELEIENFLSAFKEPGTRVVVGGWVVCTGNVVCYRLTPGDPTGVAADGQHRKIQPNTAKAQVERRWRRRRYARASG